MDPQSPPKRMTRARAAKAESSLKSTKIVTPAAKAKTAGPAATAANKRKTRADDADDEDGDDELGGRASAPAKRPVKARGRPKKTAEPEEPEQQPAPAARPRGRPRKATTTEPPPPKREPTRATRATRARRAQAEEEAAQPQAEKKTATRTTRAASTSTSTKQTTGTRAGAVKKTVKFEEPEKENMVPAGTSKGSKATATKDSSDASASGLRAKPVRKPATAAARPARKGATGSSGTQRSEEKEEKQEKPQKEKPIPLSPRKVTQMALSSRAAESEDELAAEEKTPVRPRIRGPIRLPKALARPEIQAPEKPKHEEDEEDGEVDNGQTGPVIMLGSPCRRPPPSPWKDSLKTPAKKLEAVASLPRPNQDGQQNGAEPSVARAALLQSPAKRPQSPIKGLNLQPASTIKRDATGPALMLKGSLMSPAKRPPFSPLKAVGSPRKLDDVLGRTPSANPNPPPRPGASEAEGEREDEKDEQEDEQVDEERENEEQEEDRESENENDESPSRRHFPGRLSAVLPRHADPAVIDEGCSEDEKMGEGRGGDEALVQMTAQDSPPKYSGEMFNLRSKDLLQPYHDAGDSESEDERDAGPPACSFEEAPATPCPASWHKTPRNHGTASKGDSRKSSVKRMRLDDDKLGFTPLINQLSGWKAGPDSPDVLSSAPTEQLRENGSPMRSTFFDDAMAADAGAVPEVEMEEGATQEEAAWDGGILEPEFGDMPVTEDDVALAREADEMSLMEAGHDEADHDETLSEASQEEYGDENAVPVDPALRQPSFSPHIPPVTPQRTMRGDFYTVSKVPLKPADESTPRLQSKRRHSISRLPSQNRSLFPKRATEKQDDSTSRIPVPSTPSRSEAGWSAACTPARTPRRDLDPGLLRGAVVFVDVHTSEGADASGIFVELLGQMGARCVKSWPWNPSSPPEGDGASKIGITHVVYKDGGKRTLEKVRESGGVVQCVGVSWVLDCERENQWLDEPPYYIDTSLVPRGGARRRKSMEPKALANLGGMLVSTPARGATGTAGPSRECITAPSTPANRRDSGLWMRTPGGEAEVDYEHDDDDDDAVDRYASEWDSTFLTPVPKTPAPEAIARYAANVAPETPSGETEYGGFGGRESLATRTCPPKAAAARPNHEAGETETNGQVMRRLMEARRKSLQFAPKIGSPLSRAW